MNGTILKTVVKNVAIIERTGKQYPMFLVTTPVGDLLARYGEQSPETLEHFSMLEEGDEITVEILGPFCLSKLGKEMSVFCVNFILREVIFKEPKDISEVAD